VLFVLFLCHMHATSSHVRTLTHAHCPHALQVKPVTGRMILWASQRDDDSLVPDERTTHQACNVTHGTKEAANLWVHLYDYQTPSHMGCAG
jgi:hypothetical protein